MAIAFVHDASESVISNQYDCSESTGHLQNGFWSHFWPTASSGQRGLPWLVWFLFGFDVSRHDIYPSFHINKNITS